MANKNKKNIEQAKADQEKKILDYQLRTGHARPTTRREFLQAGLISFSGMMFTPSILGMLARVNPAFAAECPAAAVSSSLVPFVTINLSGGWSAVANWLPRDVNGQLLPSYSQLGSGLTPATVTAFSNNALFTQSSDTAGFLAGVKSAAVADTISKTSLIGMPVSSNDDTSDTNRFDISGLLSKANLAGQKLPNMGQRASNTGIGQLAALNILPPRPLNVGNFRDIQGALAFVGALTTLNQNQQVALVKAVKKLSDSQARKLANLSGGENVANLVDCATTKNIENVAQGAGIIDPNQVNGMAGIWNLNDGGERARAAMAMNAINGLAGAVGMEMGGYDYHGNSRATTNQKDRDAGRLVGQVLQTAALLGKPVFIYVVSDGAVSFDTSNNAGTDANGDSGNRGASLMLAFKPNGATASASQLGGFTNGQVADSRFITGWGVEKSAAAAFVNWAQLSGDTSLIQKVIPNVFSATELALVNKFG